MLRFGFKLYAIAGSNNGYVGGFLLDEGALTRYSDDCPVELQIPGKVVYSLLQAKYLDNWHFLAVDNFYTDLYLFEQLLFRKVNCIGTVRKNKRDIPKSVLHKKFHKKNEIGERIIKWHKNLDVMVVTWMDKKEVRMLTTCGLATKETDIITREQDEFEGGRDMKKKPQIIQTYNQKMPGVDLGMYFYYLQ
jgi:hypothetical protein